MNVSQPFVIVLLAVLLLSAGCDGNGHHHDDGHSPGEARAATNFGNPHAGYCPVMGDEVEVDKAKEDPKLYSDHEGKRYLFCCKECKPKFEKEPGKYIASPAEPNKEDQSGHSHDSHDH